MTEENKYEFKAEIKKLLDILSKSLYQHKEVFIRELISNASDALTKIRFLQFQDKEIEEVPLEIEVAFNAKENTLVVRDSGIGMTKDELVEHLGTIAGSGSERFFKTMTEKQEKKEDKVDLDIIGQFGVGFYSVFMVADKVRVVSKSYKNDQPAHAWESEGTGEFTVQPADKATRGTEIILFLKADEHEFLSTWQLESTIKKYSNYVPFPIFVKEEGKTEVDVSLDEEEK
nr:ATP-binding protein [Candidatus Sigynarchaeota archaeon]